MHPQNQSFAGAFFALNYVYLTVKPPDKQRTNQKQTTQGKA